MSYATKGQQILVAEDDEQVARWLKRVFEEDGHLVELAFTGSDALRLAMEQNFALMVVDLDLPTLDGLSVVRQIRAAGRHMPVLIMTAAASDADVESGLDAGADDFLTKPVSVQVLRARARAAMRRSNATERQVMGFWRHHHRPNDVSRTRSNGQRIADRQGIRAAAIHHQQCHAGIAAKENCCSTSGVMILTQVPTFLR